MEKHSRLPTRLGKPVLIDALFEIRFEGESAADVLPGLFYSQLDGDTKIERLPISNIPAPIRQTDPNLANQPLVRILWSKYLILVGDASLTVGCQLPYPGWSQFRTEIIKIITVFVKARVAKSVNRYAIKYVDLLDGGAQDTLSENIVMSLSVGGQEIGKLPFNLNAELDVDKYRHVLQIAVPAQVQLMSGEKRAGLVLSIDTVVQDFKLPLEGLLEVLEKELDAIHSANKEMFFSCLTSEAIQKLEPQYD
jgi:uncharacterized protein (TIGR04255 family)